MIKRTFCSEKCLIKQEVYIIPYIKIFTIQTRKLDFTSNKYLISTDASNYKYQHFQLLVR